MSLLNTFKNNGEREPTLPVMKPNSPNPLPLKFSGKAFETRMG